MKALTRRLASFLAITGVVGLEYPNCINGPLASNTVCDVTAAPADRAAALVKAMTVAEKLDNLVEYALILHHPWSFWWLV
jgi:hypothetical protein